MLIGFACFLALSLRSFPAGSEKSFWKFGNVGILKDFGLQFDGVDLVSAVAAVRKNPEIVDRWAQGEAPFIPCVSDSARPKTQISAKA